MPTPAEIPCNSTAPNPEFNPTALQQPQQLALKLFERIDAFRRPPPERGLFRELLSLALRRGAEYVIGNRRIAPVALYAVAHAVHGRTNDRGIAQVSHQQLADDAFVTKRTVTAALTVLQTIGIVRMVRSSRRRESGFIAINVGGNAWNVFRRRFRQKEDPTPQLSLLQSPSSQTDQVRGDLVSPPTPVRGDLVSPPRECTYEVSTTTTTCARPEPTDRQLGFAQDLGIAATGMDVVELGSAIELAKTKRQALRTAAGNQPGPRSNGRKTTATERRRAEAEAYRHRISDVHQPAPEDPEAAAADERRKALATAAALGFRQDPANPTFLVHDDGRRVPFGPAG